MPLNEFALVLCLFLLFGTKMAVLAAAKRGDLRQVRALQYLRLGLGLSSCSYLLRLIAPPGGLASLGSFLCCLGGSLLIWIGFREHLTLTRERLARHRAAQADSEDAGKTLPAVAGLPCLTSSARHVLRHAEAEALGQRRCVDSDHLLLGLLNETGSIGGHILDRLGVKQENVRRALRPQTAPALLSVTEGWAADDPPLTDRARRVFTLAAQEAHRFDRDAVGTEHLLLGLLLTGTGDAASVLFREGANVDGIRNEILKCRSRV